MRLQHLECMCILREKQSESFVRRSSKDEDGYREEEQKSQWDTCGETNQLNKELLRPEKNLGI